MEDILTTIVLPIAVLLFVLGLVVTNSREGKQRREDERILQSGLPARGTVLRVEYTGHWYGARVKEHGDGTGPLGRVRRATKEIQIWLHVQMPNQPPYSTVLTRFVPFQYWPYFQQGCQLELRVDPADPTKVAYVPLPFVGSDPAKAPYS